MAAALRESTSERRDAGLFATTHWSLVLRARDKSVAALGTLLQSYREPMLRWLRVHGCGAQDTEDILQGFLAHALERSFLDNVARDKGRFRTFLLKCLQNYVSDLNARAAAEKRGGGARNESLDEAAQDGRRLFEPATDAAAPDREYDRAWARAVLANAQRRLREECGVLGHLGLCMELEPVMFADENAASYREIAARVGMTENAVKVAAHRIRARLKGLICDEIAQTVASEEALENEIRYFMGLFAR